MSFLKNLGRVNEAFTNVLVDGAETIDVVVSRGKEKAMHSAMLGRMEDIAEYKTLVSKSALTPQDLADYASAMSLGAIIKTASEEVRDGE